MEHFLYETTKGVECNVCGMAEIQKTNTKSILSS